MELRTLKAETRRDAGKGAARRTRRNNELPIAVYGPGGDALSLKVELPAFLQLVHGQAGEHAVVQLDIQDNPALNCPALLKKVQHHPVRGDILHADFLRIRLDQRITTSVAIRLVGQAQGVVEGGVLDHQLREVEVECLALEIPSEITADVSALDLGDSLHVADLAAPEHVTIVTDPDRTVVAVHVPRLVRAAEEVEEVAEVAEGEEAETPAAEERGEAKEEA